MRLERWNKALAEMQEHGRIMDLQEADRIRAVKERELTRLRNDTLQVVINRMVDVLISSGADISDVLSPEEIKRHKVRAITSKIRDLLDEQERLQ